MKISILQENFKKGLQITNKIANKNINLPILGNILIKTEDNNIKLISTDLDLGVSTNLRGKIEEQGEITVDSKIISDYISLLPNKKIDFFVEKEKINIKSENYKTSIKGVSAEEFPLIPQIDKKNSFKIDIFEFKKALSQVIFAVSMSETKLELSGVLFCFQNNNLFLASTDSYRLAEKKIELKKNNEENETKIIIPAKTIQELIRIISIEDNDSIKENNTIELFINENQVLFVVNETELVSKIIEGQYPDYKQIIPVEYKTKIKINKSELVRAIKTSSIFSKTDINDVSLDFPKGLNKTIISSTSSKTGDNIVEIDSVVNGDDNSIVVNYKYLLDGLNNINSDFVNINIVNSDTPCIIKGENQDDYFYIIMPIKQ